MSNVLERSCRTGGRCAGKGEYQVGLSYFREERCYIEFTSAGICECL